MVTMIRVSFRRAADPGLARLKHPVPQFFTEKGWPCAIENLYLRSRCKTLSAKSIVTVAEHLKEFLQWRMLNDIAIEDVTDTNFEYFIEAQCAHVNNKGIQLAWNTINSRVAGSHRFMIWCKENNYNSGIEVEIIPAHKYGRGGKYNIKGHPARQFKEPTKFVLMDDALEFIRILGKLSGAKGYLSQRNMLVAKLMLQCGLRVSEAINYPAFDLPEIIPTGHSTPARIVGKGNKPRVILIPNRLLSDLWAYADISRAHILENVADGNSVRELFVSGRGKPITINWMEKLFARTAAVMGVQVVPHVLRHTYGSYHYFYNKDILFLAKLMGHENTSTTEEFYVHIAKLISYTGSYEELQVEVDRMCAGM
ncbi:Site-specific recombinase XerD [Pseudomonas savastanoi pv. glycinea]|uniref:tyrosine-type recombinase/integrase n=1 Tax=Pseudomonas savastanoi TaxID=29438 RepID=UPI000F004D9D|nr:site-specific integrase [Pseudomonas savastanoi]RML43582.1 Site-specific recombinase XerD [Pseudomonas savastanoi pv. glycinea]RML89152.1 Site-specific recombinase XerD [Pseudomonas savastanoi pv. glycinea]